MRPRNRTGLSRQAWKTIEAIKNKEEKIPTSSLYSLLDCLGFVKNQRGTHITWRHPRGYKLTLVYLNKDDGIWGYALNQVRTLITQIEQKEGPFEVPVTKKRDEEINMSMNSIREKMPQREVAQFKDDLLLKEKAFQDMTKLDLTKHEEKTLLRSISTAFNEMASMVKAMQDHILELSIKVDDLKIPVVSQPISIISAPSPVKQPLTPEERKAKRTATAQKMWDERRLPKIKAIKEAQKTHPQFAKNAIVLAGITGVGAKTIEKYIEQGLV